MIREGLKLGSNERAAARTWDDALRLMFAHAEDMGVLIMRSGVVGNNTHRRLSVEEFRGFTLSDDYAPLIFINSADSKSAQMFTLAHELVHVWLGQSGVSNPIALTTGGAGIERFCNAVAAEILMPMSEVKGGWQNDKEPGEAITELTKRFKVSRLVATRRAHDAGFISRDEMREMYHAEEKRLNEIVHSAGGDFYRTQGSRLGRRFPTAIVESTLEGKTLYREAFQLLGVTKIETFRELARSLQAPV